MVTILQEPRSKPAHGLDAKYFCAWLAAALCGVLMSATAAQAAANNVSVAHGWLRPSFQRAPRPAISNSTIVPTPQLSWSVRPRPAAAS